MLISIATVVWCAAGHARAYTLKELGGNVVRWHASKVTVEVSNASHELLGNLSLVAATHKAVAAWRQVGSLPDVQVITSPNSRWGYAQSQVENHNTVQVEQDWPFDVGMLAVTVTSMDSRTGAILDADILVNAGAHVFTDVMRGASASDGATDLVSVLTHEFGHFFGLDETLDEEEATMWPYIAPGDAAARTLHVDDIEGVQAAYTSVALAVADPAASEPGAFDSRNTDLGVDSTAAAATAGGCSATDATARGGWWWLAFALLLSSRGLRIRREQLGLWVAAAGLWVLTGCTVDPENAAAVDAQPSAQESIEKQGGSSSESARAWFKGRVLWRSTRRDGALLHTRLLLVDDQGGRVEAELVGGELDGVTQHVSGYVVPAEGEEVLAELTEGRLRGWRLADDSPVVGRIKQASRVAE